MLFKDIIVFLPNMINRLYIVISLMNNGANIFFPIDFSPSCKKVKLALVYSPTVGSIFWLAWQILPVIPMWYWLKVSVRPSLIIVSVSEVSPNLTPFLMWMQWGAFVVKKFFKLKYLFIIFIIFHSWTYFEGTIINLTPL